MRLAASCDCPLTVTCSAVVSETVSGSVGSAIRSPFSGQNMNPLRFSMKSTTWLTGGT